MRPLFSDRAAGEAILLTMDSGLTVPDTEAPPAAAKL